MSSYRIPEGAHNQIERAFQAALLLTVLSDDTLASCPAGVAAVADYIQHDLNQVLAAALWEGQG